MHNKTTNQAPRERTPRRGQYAKTGVQFLFALTMGLLMALLAIGGVVYGFESRYANTIYPGVSVGGIDLSGLTLGQAVVRLNADLSYPKEGQIVFKDGGSSWSFSPEQLGYAYNPIDAAEQAFLVGRGGDGVSNLREQFVARNAGIVINPSVIYDQAGAYSVLQEIASQVDVPVVEASVSLSGTDISVNAGQVGRTVDIPATLRAIDPYLVTQQNADIPLVISESAPVIMDVQPTADLARGILSAPLTIYDPHQDSGLGPWVIEPQDLANLLIIQRNDEAPGYELSLNRAALSNYLNSVAPGLTTLPENARMIFNDDTSQLELLRSAVIGQALDIEASVDAIISQVQAGGHDITLVMKEVQPDVRDDTTAADLGITELVTESTSYFSGSDPSRIQNIRASSESFHGVFVAPGEVFSMARYLTDISLDNGYAEAIIIVGDQSVKGVGGGICQVSTTLFRTAFFGGFPIVERYPHAYRVSYYEQQSNGWVDTNLAGLDATVYVPLVDFKFKNDTPYWMLMETYLVNNSLTWKFYSTSDGRTMDWTTTGVTNVQTPPEDVYREDPTLPTGTIKQTDWAVNGATVSINRTVYKDGGVYFNDTINTTYVAWPNGYNYGPGTDIP